MSMIMPFARIQRGLFAVSNRLLRVVAPSRARARGLRWWGRHYDMVREKDEEMFALLYIHFIKDRLRRTFGAAKLSILDAGCGQGRITIPLALMGHEVVGVDLSERAIEAAKQNAQRAAVTPRLLAGDLNEALPAFGPGTFDCVISTEVLYLLENYEELISHMVRLLRPGGLLIISLRTKLFYAMLFVMRRDLKKAAGLIVDGNNFFNDRWLNCQGADEMVELLSRNHLREIEAKSIGVMSGISGDPQSIFAIPSQLNEEERELLLKMEIALGETIHENARYILLSGVKPS